MEWLNYHHLLYFWVVATEGGLTPAGKVLRVSHPTLSAQIHALEERLGEKLFVKSGRKLVLTDTGRIVYRYADEIFGLGREMLETLRGQAPGKPLRLRVGIVDALPKLVVRRLLEPALALPDPVRLVCREDSFERLLGDLAMHALDIVISDAPVPPGSSVRAFHHLLGETSLSFFAVPAVAARYRKGFPASLNEAPLLLPLEVLTLRRTLNAWFARHRLQPQVVAEFEDNALLTVFGAEGLGIFPSPTVIEKEIVAQFGVEVVGRTDELKERYYATSIERRLSNSAAVAIFDSARGEMFA